MRDPATAVNPQAFRRTFATWMQRTGATVKDVQGAMRHSTPDQTLKVYMREIPNGVRNAVDALDQLYSGKRGLAGDPQRRVRSYLGGSTMTGQPATQALAFSLSKSISSSG